MRIYSLSPGSDPRVRFWPYPHTTREVTGCGGVGPPVQATEPLSDGVRMAKEQVWLQGDTQLLCFRMFVVPFSSTLKTQTAANFKQFHRKNPLKSLCRCDLCRHQKPAQNCHLCRRPWCCFPRGLGGEEPTLRQGGPGEGLGSVFGITLRGAVKRGEVGPHGLSRPRWELGAGPMPIFARKPP